MEPKDKNEKDPDSVDDRDTDLIRDRLGKGAVPPALQDPAQREQWGLPATDTGTGPYLVELNLVYRKGLEQAQQDFQTLWRKAVNSSDREPLLISRSYYRCQMSVREWRKLVELDEQAKDPLDRIIYKVWPDFPVKALIDRSITTVKADAAVRAYAATGSKIVWAVVDSGIDANHRHFQQHQNLRHPSIATLHRDFTQLTPVKDPDAALVDPYGHGTHVAGIIAGGLCKTDQPDVDFAVYENVFASDSDGSSKPKRLEKRLIEKGSADAFSGVAPQCRLVSLRALDENGRGRTSNIMLALQYIRENLNGDPKLLRVHGVNLSIGYEFDPELFACGQSPLCVEVDRLVKSGVVVVVAAGNTGFGRVQAFPRETRIGLSNTINDPGNAALAITVGATHRDSPHTYGVSFFSSKGPTGDGRLKPDLVAPGERITSCAAGRRLKSAGGNVPNKISAYVDDSGTSMAAPHVSGAIAAFLSIRREFIQKPEKVKEIFLTSATPLGRERYFEGHGLVDLMRAIQSV